MATGIGGVDFYAPTMGCGATCNCVARTWWDGEDGGVDWQRTMAKQYDRARHAALHSGGAVMPLPARIQICSLANEARLDALLDAVLAAARDRTVVGWDTERTYARHKRLALVQLATDSDVLLVCVPPGARPSPDGALVRLFGDATIAKAGYALAGDTAALNVDLGITTLRNVVDLAPHRRRTLPLCSVVALTLGVDMTGDYRALASGTHPRFSAWGKPWLCPCQITYAARDAYACRILYDVRSSIELACEAGE